MKPFLPVLFIVSVISCAQSVFANDSLNNSKDDYISRTAEVLGMNGALQLDNRAVETGANEWNIKVSELKLEGETIEAVDEAWNAFLAKEQSAIISDLHSIYPDVVPATAKTLSDELTITINSQTDGMVFIQQGIDNEKARKWLLEELLTRAGRANVSFYLEDKYREKFDFFRYHFDDTSMEVIGNDLLIIRGVRNVIIVRISYMHS